MLCWGVKYLLESRNHPPLVGLAPHATRLIPPPIRRSAAPSPLLSNPSPSD
jgi:hypothetical protein